MLLQQAEAYQARDAGVRSVSMTARQAVQTAEDARLIALKAQAEARLAAERSAAAEREAQARAAADNARNAAQAEAQRRALAEQEQRLEAERRARAEAETAAAQALARADAERAARDQARVEAEADRARQAAEKAEQEKQQLRRQLIDQLNLILETRDSARGLIVNMSDVLFDTGKYTLKPGAREKLAKVAGIVLAHPGLMLEVEGHTDSVGSEEYNQKLSEQRATSVRDFLVQQGIKSNIAVKGMGELYPVVSNDTAAGRQQNRRVEMIVSGDVIGVQLGPQTSK
jgi:outer membrane protein OmpA-like peptidoglycan-associated protein